MIIAPTLNMVFKEGVYHPLLKFSRASTATRINARGLIEAVAADALRIDHDPASGECLGLLSEEQRTNSLLCSQAFDNAAWTKSGTTVSANAATAPDGTNAADKIVETLTAGAHLVLQSASYVSGTSYAASVVARAGERTQLTIAFPAIPFGAGQSALFDLSLGTATVVTGSPVCGITPLGGFLYRCWMVKTATITAPISNVAYYITNGTTSYTGDGASGLYLWGAQLESGAFPTSYIPTEASAVTRAAEVATVALSGFAFNASEGTLYVEAISAIGGSGQRVVDLNDGSTLKIIQMSNAGVYNGYVKDGTVQANIVGGTWAPATLAKLALGYKINNFALATNGAISGTDASGSVPAGLTGMYIGSQVGGVYFNGHIKHLQYFPRRMPNADLQTLTR